MKVELIPVIEVDLRHQDLVKSLASVVPLSSEAFLYRASDLAVESLKILSRIHLQGYFDGEWTLDEQCTFFGGYVLRLAGHDTLFPQCCGELSDIIYWKNVAKYGRSVYYHGHPHPEIYFTDDSVVFNCQNDYEEFRPSAPLEVSVPKIPLSAAYDTAVLELALVAHRLRSIADEACLPADDIAHLLIYRNTELPTFAP
ncbi:hypothetical protein [Hymenobacter perfusus]|uniref:Uncharacterized protein n=1 Tax=Hymenobacter perfusus TaxID=1236770 RepID=A0A3R9NBQ4_9BACT|nr:hypothetical protein [Hymenobacter perfusus]RSK43466.1 hypothetical protein EI293_11265 [Hymenobacter perfusus]